MPSYSIAKSSITCLGASHSGPGTFRDLLIQNDTFSGSINEDLEIQEYKKGVLEPVEVPVNFHELDDDAIKSFVNATADQLMQKKPHYPVEIPIQLSEQAETILQNYLDAHSELEAAKLKFAKAKDAFAKSEGGKEIQKHLFPQPETLPVEEVVSDEDVQQLRTLVENVLGDTNSIIKCTTLVKGYNMGKVIMKLEKPIPFSSIESITYKDYTWTNPMKTYSLTVPYKGETTHILEFAKPGSQYPPYREEDYKEVSAAEKKRRNPTK